MSAEVEARRRARAGTGLVILLIVFAAMYAVALASFLVGSGGVDLFDGLEIALVVAVTGLYLVSAVVARRHARARFRVLLVVLLAVAATSFLAFLIQETITGLGQDGVVGLLRRAAGPAVDDDTVAVGFLGVCVPALLIDALRKTPLKEWFSP